MINVKGYRVLVKLKEIERVSDGGIIVSIEGTREDRLEQAGNQFGIVDQIGHTCWKGGVDETPWCEVGDMIALSKHSGRFLFDPHTNDEYVIINDTDVLGVVTDE